MKGTFIAIMALAAVVGNAQSLYNNATFNGLANTGLETDVRPAGGHWSRLQGLQNTFGFSANPTFRLAEDFTVGAGGWNVTNVHLFGYNTGATAPTITGGTAEIRTGSVTGAVVGTLTYSSTSFVAVYRETTTTTLSNRQIQKSIFTYSGPALSAGSHWITYNFNLTAAGASIFVPALTQAGSSAALPGANAQQSNAGVWAAAQMGGTLTNVELPLYIDGTAVPEPATMAALGLGAAALLRRRRK